MKYELTGIKKQMSSLEITVLKVIKSQFSSTKPVAYETEKKILNLLSIKSINDFEVLEELMQQLSHQDAPCDSKVTTFWIDLLLLTWPTYENSNHSVPHRGHCFSLIPGVGAMNKGEYKTLSHICIMAMCDDDREGTIYYHGCDTRILPSTLILVLNISIELYAWTAIEQTDNSQSHKGYCFSKVGKIGAMEKGEIKMKPGECIKVECKGGGLIVHSGCDPVHKNCLNKPNLITFYPECCGKNC
ncbi:hypothetical protein RN001_001688 [Aquatica leii]|uniref:Uncharacterized protein n=1 Tax=Aquatica leii TaxID=1421715 RepID=A0AAN7PG93_9COLE|nr:hypothetical protein RN001_001688 [Aquatica leii]